MNKRLSLKEFRDFGYLLEVNRNFFHPLGLALAVYYSEDDKDNMQGIDPDVSEPIGLFIYDYREAPEGVIFGDFSEGDKAKVVRVEKLQNIRNEARLREYGYVIQPVDLGGDDE